MEKTSRKIKKTSKKQARVIEAIRKKILSGEYAPGTQIPIQTELVQKFKLSSVTVQRAVHELKRQGFLTAKRRLGTFIAEQPPHLKNYALVFPADPAKSVVWGNFWESLRLEAEKINKRGVKRIEFFFGAEEFEHSKDYLRLVELVRNHQLAGLIFAAPPHNLMDTPLMTVPDMPRVAIASLTKYKIPVVSHADQNGLFTAARRLSERGAKRVALFCTATTQVEEWLRRQSELADLGIRTREQWCFTIPATVPGTAKACTRLLMDLPAEDRPDGVIVMDDHLTEAVEQGLIDAGHDAATQVGVVALCNFPDRFAHRLPIQRLGCNAVDFLNLCIESIDAQRNGDKVQKQVFVKAYFEE